MNTAFAAGGELLTPEDVFVINIFGVWAVDALAFGLAKHCGIGLGLTAVCLSGGFDDPLTKPLYRETLVKTLADYV